MARLLAYLTELEMLPDIPMNHPPYQLTDRGRRDELVIFSDESNIGEA